MVLTFPSMNFPWNKTSNWWKYYQPNGAGLKYENRKMQECFFQVIILLWIILVLEDFRGLLKWCISINSKCLAWCPWKVFFIQLNILLTFLQKKNFLIFRTEGCATVDNGNVPDRYFSLFSVRCWQCSLVHDLRPDLSLSPGENILKKQLIGLDGFPVFRVHPVTSSVCVSSAAKTLKTSLRSHLVCKCDEQAVTQKYQHLA